MAVRDLTREARVAGVHLDEGPSLSAIERRRGQLHAVLFVVMGCMGLAVALLSIAGETATVGLLALPAFRASSPLLAGALAFYVVDKERHLKRLTRMLMEDHAVMAQLVREARHDPLTGLLNRAGLSERLEAMLGRARRHGQRFGLLFVDLDGFKRVNDTLGHLAGDSLLVDVARRLQGAIRPEDMVARLSGDEFVVVVDQVEGDDDAIEAAQRVNDVIAAIKVEGEQRITASIGVALADATTESTATLLREADLAMYMAKGAGRAGWVRFDPMLVRDP